MPREECERRRDKTYSEEQQRQDPERFEDAHITRSRHGTRGESSKPGHCGGSGNDYCRGNKDQAIEPGDLFALRIMMRTESRHRYAILVENVEDIRAPDGHQCRRQGKCRECNRLPEQAHEPYRPDEPDYQGAHRKDRPPEGAKREKKNGEAEDCSDRREDNHIAQHAFNATGVDYRYTGNEYLISISL